MTKYKIATIKDIPTLCKLLETLFSQEVEFQVDQNKQSSALEKIIQDDTLGDIFICTKDDVVIAMVNILYTISTALGTKVAILEDMIVDKNYRGKNIGTELINYALQNIKLKGCTRVTLLSDNDNIKAHNFYKKQGFSPSFMLPFRKVL